MHIGLNAHLLATQPGYRTAGIHGYISNLLAHLPQAAPDDWELTAMVGANNVHQFNGIHMQRSRLNTESPARRILWEQAVQPLQLRNFDLYHALAFVSPLALYRPSVVTVYDLSFVYYPQVLSTARRLYLRLFTALSCKRARRVIAISQSTANDLHTTFNIPPDQIDVAVPGYDHERFHPLPQATVEQFRTESGLPERFWLFLGTLEPRKNLITLLDAYATLPSNERLPLVLAGGKGWDYEAIFARVDEHGLQGAVHFPGFITAEALPLWYNSAELLVYPSIYEGFGLPVLEAMACGTPVVVSNASSLPEAAGDVGIQVSPHDIQAWATALRSAYRDSDWRQQASEAGVRHAARFTWNQTAQRTITCYQRVLAGND